MRCRNPSTSLTYDIRTFFLRDRQSAIGPTDDLIALGEGERAHPPQDRREEDWESSAGGNDEENCCDGGVWEMNSEEI